MDYLEFRNRFFELGCFSVNQVLAWYPSFQRNNLSRWLGRGLILRLRQGYYAFPEYTAQPGFAYFVSNYIYKPSYVSTHAALAFYGVIPEASVRITAVSALKTMAFTNSFGTFSYQKVKPSLFFGYEQKESSTRFMLIATPEKAILDLLYLYPFYNTEEELLNLRFDTDFMQSELDGKRLSEYTERFESKRLSERVCLLRRVYD
ncbi:MAG: hypothetical protein LBS85_00805 [Clostridiales Family XIII bacterium]|jgi:predicted transcriptional regulator of viral defense system|nr:hypothetical protein [Clostridiales Family XIII bacterium]